ncbi:Radial spoke head 10-like protein B-like [Oopsacas minuta]|uniref:Radial spoke head 10-like protein B-like n=1 Tax=Oopsacas minuta TaxID=111878 RepID=A0AAV7K6B9_9METZ|nr:Radial spoke head 10-like protein B-like [Oopsacas minuta]
MTSNQTATDNNQSVIDTKLWNCLTSLVSNNSRWIGSVSKESDLFLIPPLSETILDTSHQSSLNCVSRNVQETEGLCKFLTGNFYEGEFRNGKMDGKGVYLWADGDKYEGEVVGNKIQGNGTYRWTDGSVYSGEVRDGLRNGSGVLRMIDGNYYDGNWRDGKMNGVGRMVFECDEEGNPVSYYEGEFRDNLRGGPGIRVYRSGNFYSGEWLNNLPHGKGRMEWKDRREVYTGDWSEGVQNGYGEMLWKTELVNSAQFPNKNRYIGDWRGGQRNGKGVMYYATGAVYSGGWTADRKEGTGVYTQPNGDRVEGEFRDDKLFCAKEVIESRPITPMSQLVGDVDDIDSSSRSEAFKNSLLHLIPNNLNPDLEVKAVHNILLTNIGELKWIYHFYSNLGVTPGAAHSFTRLKLWQLLIDCQIFYKETFCEVNKLLCIPLPDKHTPELVHHPYVEFLLREFLQCLVVLGHHLFCKMYGGEPGRLAWCLKYLIEEIVLPNACRGKGYLYQTPEMVLISEPYFASCEKLYNAICEQLNGTISYRSFLFMMDDCHMLDLVAIETVLSFIINTNPFVYEEDCYKIMLQMNFLEFFNTLLSCAKLTGPNNSAILFEQMSKQGASNNEGAEVDKMGSLYQSGSSAERESDKASQSHSAMDSVNSNSEDEGIQMVDKLEEVGNADISNTNMKPRQILHSQEDYSSKDSSNLSVNLEEEEEDKPILPTYIPPTATEEIPYLPVIESESDKWQRQLTTFFDEHLFPDASIAFLPPKYRPFSLT